MPTTDLPPELWRHDEDDPFRAGLTVEKVTVWCREVGLGPAVDVVEGPEIPSAPGAMLVVSWTAGAGFSFEQMLDTPGFQLRMIGPQGNLAAAKELAERLDAELVNRDRWPGLMGGEYVVSVRRAGGKPSHDRTDTAHRAHYVCTYLADVEAS